MSVLYRNAYDRKMIIIAYVSQTSQRKAYKKTEKKTRTNKNPQHGKQKTKVKKRNEKSVTDTQFVGKY